MTEDLVVRDETPASFFREELLKAMEHQKVSTSAFTEFYLVNLLAHCLRTENIPIPDPPYDETPLAFLYVNALKASRSERARLLRATGDMALFVSGFFGASLAGRLIDLHYYTALGGRAYAHLSQEGSLPFGPDVFSELAGRFTEFADLFSEVSETTRLTSSRSVVQLYERWLQTGSRRSAQLLAERGITPLPEGKGVQ